MNKIKKIIREELLQEATFGNSSFIQGNTSDTIIFRELKANDMKGIKDTLKALSVLDLTKYDILAIGYGDWEDKQGDAIFLHEMLVELKGKKVFAQPEHGTVEEIIPSSGAKIGIRVY